MLVLRNVSYSYPLQEEPAVQELSLEVSPGEVCLVTGASGCGKSTLIRLINGLCPHFFSGMFTGEVSLSDYSVSRGTLRETSARVGTVFQDPETQFFALHVEDEIAFAHEWQAKSPDAIRRIVEQTAGKLGISKLLGASIHELSEGQKQKVALASVLSGSPEVVVLDEPSANLDPDSTQELARLINDLKARGVTVLIVDHRLYWLQDVADRVIIMEEGRIAASGGIKLLNAPETLHRYGLRSANVTDLRTHLPGCPDTGPIEIRDLSFTYRNGPRLFNKDSLALPAGVTGIIGGNGCGKTTLARLLTGLNRWQSGVVFFGKQPVKPAELLKRSSIILQNTDHQLHMRTVTEELAMSAGAYRSGGLEKARLIEILAGFNLDHLADRHPQSLSGGEKQRLVIACGMAKKPDILILDEPTSGLDGHNMKNIATMINKAADTGTIVIVITHDLELLELCCRFALRLPLGSTDQNSGNTI